MSTRGAYGFRIGGQDKIIYNHSDSYPSWLGKRVIEFLDVASDTALRQIAERLTPIPEDGDPTPEQQQRYAPWADVEVSGQSAEDWYCLLRKTQGHLECYLGGPQKIEDGYDKRWNRVFKEVVTEPVTDYQDVTRFLNDSLFCEWAYIFNIDTGELEFYRGGNKDAAAQGRYAALRRTPTDGYRGVALMCSVPFAKLRDMSAQDRARVIDILQHWGDDEANDLISEDDPAYDALLNNMARNNDPSYPHEED